MRIFHQGVFAVGNIFFKLIQAPGLNHILINLHRKLRPHHYQRVEKRWQSLLDNGFIEQHKLTPKYTSTYFKNIISNAEASWYSLQIPQETLWLKTQFSSETPVSSNQWIQLLTQDKPQVFWGAHSGPFEALHQVLCHPHKEVHLITQAKPSDLMSKLRSHHRSNLKIWQSTDFSKAVKATIQSNGILALLVDQSNLLQNDQSSRYDEQLFDVSTPIQLKLISKLHKMGLESTHFSISSLASNKYSIHYQSTHHLQQDELNRVIEKSILKNPIDFVWHYKWHWPSLNSK